MNNWKNSQIPFVGSGSKLLTELEIQTKILFMCLFPPVEIKLDLG